MNEFSEIYSKFVVHCKRSSFDVYIGRDRYGNGEWGNPFPMHNETERTAVVVAYARWLFQQPALLEKARRELKGKVLGCWCSPKLCHGHVLAIVANADPVLWLVLKEVSGCTNS